MWKGSVRNGFNPIAESIRGLIKQVDLLYKLTARTAELGTELSADEAVYAVYERRSIIKLLKQLDDERKPFTEEDAESLADVVYGYVWQRRASGNPSESR